MWLQLDGDGTLQGQTYRALRQAILRGRLGAGARLPSTRGLARESGLARNTVLHAYQQLVDEGYAVTRRGAGTFVVDALPEETAQVAPTGLGRRGPLPPPRPPRLSRHGRRVLAAAPGGVSWAAPRPTLPFDFRYGEPGTLDLPYASWCRTLQRRARRATRRELGYGPPGGDPALRGALAGYLARARGVSCTPDQVVVVQGSQQAIDLAARLLVDPDDPVVLEEPSYPGFRIALEAAGARLRPVPVDDDGLRCARLPEGGARLACVTPSHQFPTGVVLPLPRRLALLEWARRHDAYVLEDDYDSEFRYEGRPLASLQGLDAHGRVIYTGTFSKVLFPSLRIGYAVLPEALVEPFLAAQGLASTGGATLEQRALADFLEEGHFERHLRRARQRNAGRREALLEAIGRELGDAVELSGTNAGLHLVAWLRGMTETRARELRRRAAGRGVGVYPLRPFYVRAPRRPGLMLGYAHLDGGAIREGVARLAEEHRALARAAPRG